MISGDFLCFGGNEISFYIELLVALAFGRTNHLNDLLKQLIETEVAEQFQLPEESEVAGPGDRIPFLKSSTILDQTSKPDVLELISQRLNFDGWQKKVVFVNFFSRFGSQFLVNLATSKPPRLAALSQISTFGPLFDALGSEFFSAERC